MMFNFDYYADRNPPPLSRPSAPTATAIRRMRDVRAIVCLVMDAVDKMDVDDAPSVRFTLDAAAAARDALYRLATDVPGLDAANAHAALGAASKLATVLSEIERQAALDGTWYGNSPIAETVDGLNVC